MYIHVRKEVIIIEANVSEDNQSQSEDQSQTSSDNRTTANIENGPPELQAAEPMPKPVPSFGLIEASEDIPSLTFGKNAEPPAKPEPSFGTHKKEAPRKSSQSAEKGDQED